jgi:tRNA-specific adenosine deaminase 1
MKRSFEEDEKDDFYEQIALSCYNKFNELSSRGKPSLNEWTHLAAFVSVNQENQIEILSIGTGTKCLGGEKEERGTNGCLLHDSHAEVIARRSLLRFFYEEILNENNLILIKQEKNKFYLNKSIKIYLFVSYPPCGAAAYLSDPIKRPKFEHKSLNSSGDEELYLKPGKGYQTTSLSCTNKINRWICQGCFFFLSLNYFEIDFFDRC